MFAANYSATEGQINDAENEDSISFKLPDFTPTNPWPSSPNFEEDFIMISEFCEIEGPNPLLVIPTHGGGAFNKEQFAVNIMSVDYNATNSSRAASGEFTISDDTCLLQEELREGAHAYVHHFTLYDIYARGFVRPFCLAYITSEKSKLVNHFEIMMNKFRKVTEAFKYGNRHNFCEDLKRKLKDLAFTKGKNDKISSDNKDLEDFQKIMAELDKAIQETTHILTQFESQKINKRLERRFKKMEATVVHQRQRVLSQSASLHGDGYHSDCDETPKQFNIRKCHSNDILDGSRETSYQPKLIKVDGYRKFDVNLRSLHELCLWGSKIGMAKLKKFYKYFSRRSETLSMERMESDIEKPSSSLLTIGRTVTVNFIPENYVQYSRAPSHQCHNLHSGCRTCNLSDRMSIMTCSSANTVPLLTDDEDGFGLLPSSYETKFISGSAFASTESLYYDAYDNQSISDSSSDTSDEFDDGWVEITDSSSLVSSSPHQTSGSCFEDNTSLGSEGQAEVKGRTQPDNDVTFKDNDEDKLSGSAEDTLEVDSGMAQSDNGRSNDVKLDSLGSSSSQTTPALIRCASGISIDKLVRVPMDSIPVVDRIPVGCYASWLSNSTSKFPGFKLKNFLSHCSFASHLIYALFSGRMVVITGPPIYQREIKSLITMLSLFIPGHSRHHFQITPWYTKPLTILDVGRMKLVGLAKVGSLHRVIPNVVRNYVSIFDFEKQELYTPPYQGTYVHALVNKSRMLRSDVSFVAYIQTVFLEMASKAFLYYHSYCLADHNAKNSSELMNPSKEKETIEKFLAKLGIADGDTHIIMYWTELIKQQQLLGMNSFTRCGNLPLQSIHLDYRICSKFTS
ncbi:guanine nucleotide exchange protein SMCR8-like isoform X2 [Anneissia japonica]|uniref:guanine nucleotide exchange protein SMCR8-like isoform X2 n=1 Tax=Anneissia japonica TaxID=1529436 RepID=UPI00142590EA|nr:guanine nucleotide exchange protein SMCR8-like isoform X2 [Anneissia japonica]